MALCASMMNDLLTSYVRTTGLVHHHFVSFHDFIDVQLPKIIASHGRKHIDRDGTLVTFKQKYSRMAYDFTGVGCQPKLLCDYFTYLLTYTCDVKVFVTEEWWDTKNANVTSLLRRAITEVTICRIPMMVGSKYCITKIHPTTKHMLDPYCDGGFFVIKGNKKVIVTQRKVRYNHPYTLQLKLNKRPVIKCETRSVKSEIFRSSTTTKLDYANGKIFISIPKTPMDLYLVFDCLGLDSHQIRAITYFKLRGVEKWRYSRINDILNLVKQDPSLDGDNALARICDATGRTPESINSMLTNDLLPHIHFPDQAKTKLHKGFFLVEMLVKLVAVIVGYRPLDDRYHMEFDSMHTSGYLMSILFRQLLSSSMKTLEYNLRQQTVDVPIANLVSAQRMSQSIHYAFATGTWGARKVQEGVVQLLTGMNRESSISHLRRINLSINPETQATAPRQQHISQYGNVCNVETTEGKTCGLTSAFAITNQVRVAFDHRPLIRFMESKFASMIKRIPAILSTTGLADMTLIHVNGVPIFLISSIQIDIFVRTLRLYRRTGQINYATSIIRCDHEPCVNINTDSGCCIRPLINLTHRERFLEIILKYHSHPQVWNIVLSSHLVDYVSKSEELQSDYHVAIVFSDIKIDQHTHLEINPNSMMGVTAMLIPFPQHNQAPRNIYATCMMKQAKPPPDLFTVDRFATVAHAIDYVQTPLVSTVGRRISQFQNRPAGSNVVIAILTHELNQEDSIVFNQDSVDRGLFRSIRYSSVTSEEQNSTAQTQQFCNPTQIENCLLQKMDYSLLDVTGLAKVGVVVNKSQAIIGKVSKNIKQQAFACHSCVHTGRQRMFVDECASFDDFQKKIVRVKLRRSNIPMAGDKFCAVCGQKGTIGGIIPGRDMPFDANGVQPDIIINPHAIPSRMTIGLLMEMITGIAVCSTGRIADGTAFNGTTHQDIGKVLQSRGFRSDGHRTMIDGITGKMLRAKVCQGLIFYQSLKHMVIDKMHARHKGPIQNLTRQPVEGRARNGGLRVGEMERDAIISHGASSLLQDRLFKASDDYSAPFCDNCQVLVSRRRNGGQCQQCGNPNLRTVEIPYAFKLLNQELQSCHYQMLMTRVKSRS